MGRNTQNTSRTHASHAWVRLRTYRRTRMCCTGHTQIRHATITMSQRIILIQDDELAATGVLDALKNSSDVPFEVEWVRRCSEGLEITAGAAAVLVDLYLPDSRGISPFEPPHRAP